MRKYTLLILFIFTICIANGQQSISAIKKAASVLKIDPNLMPHELTALRMITLWDSLNSDEQKNSVYLTLPITTWRELFEIQYKHFEITKNDNLLFKLRYPLALIYFESGNNDKSLELLEYLHKRKQRLEKGKIKNVLLKIEEIYRDRGEMAKAIAIRKERIEYGFKGNYWAIYRDCGLYEAAIEDYKLFEPNFVNFNINNIRRQFHLGELYFKNSQADSALKYYQLGLTITNETILRNNKRYPKELLEFWKGNFTGLIAKCEIKKGNLRKAIPMLKYDISYSELDKPNKLGKMIILSDCYLLLNDIKNAKKYLDTININFENLNFTRNKYKLTLLKLKSDYFSKTKQYDSAYHYLKAYSQLNDLQNANIKKNQAVLLLTQLEMGKRRYELKSKILNLKESEEENKNKSVKITNLMLVLTLSTIIALFLVYVIFLNNKNKKTLTLKNILLEENIKKNQEHILHNDLLLKELHHRVKNNLQLMYSLLNLQKRRNNNIEIKSNLSTVQNRIQTMALVHEYLYNSENFESVEAFKYIETLSNHLKSIYKQENRNIEQVINIEASIQLPIEQIISLGLIINEIISNSYKYAFNNNNGSKLEITLVKINDLILLEISDDGPGFSKDQINEDSLGLKLIEIMCAQIKAKLSTRTNNGVSYHIEFTI